MKQSGYARPASIRVHKAYRQHNRRPFLFVKYAISCSILPTAIIGSLLLTGCGTTIGSRDVNNISSIALSSNRTTLLPGEQTLLSVATTNVAPSTVHLTLQCDAEQCGSLDGDIFTAPQVSSGTLIETVTARSSRASVRPSVLQLQIVQPLSVTALKPDIIPAGTTQTINAIGTGFNPASTIAVSSGLPLHIADVHVLSGTLMTFSATAPLDQVGVARITMQNETPKSTSSIIDLIIEPNIKQMAAPHSTFNVGDYFASGSSTVYHCSGIAGSFVITCDGDTLDFQPHQGIRIVGAGQVEANPAIVEQPSITDQGQTIVGTHTYCYVAFATDALGGISAPSPETCVANEPNHSYRGSYVQLTAKTYTIPLSNFLWYVSEDDGPYQLFDLGVGNANVEDVGQRLGSRGGWPASFPSSSSDISKNEDLFSTIVAIKGNEIILHDSLAATIVDTEVDHDDTGAFQDAIDSAAAAGGGTIKIGSGTFNLRRPSFEYWPNTPSPYPSFTTSYNLKPSYAGYYNLYLKNGSTGNILFEGDGSSTTINTSPDFGGYGSLIALGVYSNPAYAPFKATKMEAVDKGSSTIILANNEAGVFHPGDDIWLYSGSFGDTPCVDSAGTAGGNCHFSELNSVKAVSGRVLTLAYPTSKRYYDDGANSFGLVKLPVTPHDIGIEDITINTYNPVFESGMVYGLVVDGVVINGSPTHGPFGGGLKRDILIENSTWGLGSGNASWDGTEEFDEYTNLSFINNTITGYAAPGAEGPSLTARIYLTEGTSQVVFEKNQLNHAVILFQASTDDIVDNNLFNDGDVSIGSDYNLSRHPFLTGAFQDATLLSFGSQVKAEVSNNVFKISSDFTPPWIIDMGHFSKGVISDNQITSNSVGNFAAINSGGGYIEGNVIKLGSLSSLTFGIAAVPDQGPGLPVNGFIIRNNRITATSTPGGLVVVNAGFANTAPVCIVGNSIDISRGNPVSIAPSTTNLSCDGESQ